MQAFRSFVVLAALAAPLACSLEDESGQNSDGATDGNGGSAATGGSGGSLTTGGGGGSVTTGGSGGSLATGGSGGSLATGGSGGSLATGGSGGALTTGGTGGALTTGGSSGVGGGSTGGNGSGGGENFAPPFILGADVSLTQGWPTFTDTDGESKSIFDLLKNHGFNYIRLKTFVEPTAMDWNGCTGSNDASKDRVIEYGAQVKAAGMGFMLNFHYSDIWADPGNQIIPRAWRGATTPEELAEFMEEYTYDVVSSAIEAGARPDMVQVGNEITHGILYDFPGPDTDCQGNDPVDAPFAIAGWEDQANFVPYLNAGIRGVHRADPSIDIVLHMERPEEAVDWLGGAVDGGVDVDIFGLSCYESYQGGYTECRDAFEALIADSRFDEVDFVVAEYNPQRTEMNLMMRDLPDGRGLGTFFWEPTISGSWGSAMFDGRTAIESDFAEYDAMLSDLGLEAW